MNKALLESAEIVSAEPEKEQERYEADGLQVRENGNPICECYLRSDAVKLAAVLNTNTEPSPNPELVESAIELNERISACLCDGDVKGAVAQVVRLRSYLQALQGDK